jgi:flagella basal body P-ring formation protein FlgA
MPSRDHFEGIQGMNVLVGLTLARDVKKGQPLRFSDIQRPQLVAARPIPSGKRIERSDFTKALSTYDLQAAREGDRVEGRRALVAI